MNVSNILVTGGAGYIGSHVVKHLMKQGHRVYVIDDLSSGHPDFVPAERLIVSDFADHTRIRQILSLLNIDTVCHLAASISVEESCYHPNKYYQNNVANTVTLLDAMLESNVKQLMFASTCAVYGDPQLIPLTEAHPTNPLSVYGSTKLMAERILKDYQQAYGLRSICFRFYNAAGADPEGQLGESRRHETHLIPLAISAAMGERDQLKLFGDDYETSDGTCVRDYIHVADIARAFACGLDYFNGGGSGGIFNLCNEKGFSVKEVIDTVYKVSGTRFRVEVEDRRPGDAPILVGIAQKARTELGWIPQYSDIETIVQHAWNWQSRTRKTSVAPQLVSYA